jgi:RES domain-containing protein
MIAASDMAGPVTPFVATAFFASAEPVRNVEDMVTIEGNRWSRVDEPTVYLAGDPSLALAEFARHGPPDGMPEGLIWSVDVRLEAIVDVRDPESRLAAEEPPRWLDHDWCHALAGRLRGQGGCDGLVVPSAALLDRPERWNLVVFVDRLKRPLADALIVQGTTVAIRPTTQAAAAPT